MNTNTPLLLPFARMNTRQYAHFSDLPLQTMFVMNGSLCKKVSTRTAHLIEYGRTFYFGKRELCIVGSHSRLASDYFTTTKG